MPYGLHSVSRTHTKAAGKNQFHRVALSSDPEHMGCGTHSHIDASSKAFEVTEDRVCCVIVELRSCWNSDYVVS